MIRNDDAAWTHTAVRNYFMPRPDSRVRTGTARAMRALRLRRGRR